MGISSTHASSTGASCLPTPRASTTGVVDEPDRFKADLCTTLGFTIAEFATLITQVRRYRDSFVAHLDNERMMRLPTLELPKRSIAFLHERLPQEARSYEDWEGLPTTAEQLDQGFTRAFHEAQSVYAEALEPSAFGFTRILHS
jgi:hypothetical protein